MATSAFHPLATAAPTQQSAKRSAGRHRPAGGSRRFEPVVSVDLPLEVPVTDAEMRLVGVYLGDLIDQILSETE